MSERGDPGFTLLEVTVTLGILSIVLAIVYGVFSQTIEGKELAERRADESAGARGALARITRDLENARPVTVSSSSEPQRTPGRTTTTQSIFPPQRGLFLARVHAERGSALDDLAFTTFLRRPTATTFAASDLGIVHYFVDAIEPRSPVLALYRETVFSLSGDLFDPDKPNPAASTIVLEGVTELDFRFFDGTDWLDSWDSSDSRKYAAAPLAVEIALSTLDRDGKAERYVTSVDVPMSRSLKSPQVVGRPTPRP